MISTRKLVTTFFLAAAVTLVATTALARQADQTASQFYMAYRAAFQKATKIEDVLPYMSKAMRSQVDQTPAAERPMMFGMIKKMDSFTEVKVIKETKTAAGVTLSVEGTDSGKKSTATVDIVRENGAWKLGKERWSSSSRGQ
jgi:hypothetical protein